MDKEKLKKYLFPALLILFAAIFLTSIGVLINYATQTKTNKDKYDKLAQLVQQQQQQQTVTTPDGIVLDVEILSPYVEVTHPETGETLTILREYAPLFELNPDVVGWIRIDGTLVNYPVMHTPNEGSYYLYRDFYGDDDKHGCIYAYATSDVFTPSDNVTIGGHNMRNDSMFGTLHYYEDPEFFKNHRYITFDTLFEHHTYEIISVFYTTDYLDTGFAYHWFVNGTEEEFNEFIATAKELSMYDIEATATYGDKLITLSTCDDDYVDSHGRFAIVAKRIA